MIKKFIGALALAIAFTVAFVPSSATAAPNGTSGKYGSGSFTVGNAQLLSSGCFYHPYTVNLTTVGTSYWDVDIRITASNGAIFDLEYISGTGTGTGAFAEETFICSSLDQPGTYTITGIVTTYDYYYDEIASTSLTPATFQILPYAAPVPPVVVPPVVVPPVVVPPAPVYADVKGTVSKKMVDRGVAFTFKAKDLAAGAVVRNKLQWSIVSDSKVWSFTQKPGNTKKKVLTFPRRSGKHPIKVLRNGKVAMKVTVRA